MRQSRSWITTLVMLPLVLVALVASVLVGLAMPAPTAAVTDIAMTGSFYSQDFSIPAGSGVSGPSIYVKVTNRGTEQLVVKMSYESVQGVTIGLSRGEFVLEPGNQQEVQVSVNVPATALSGVYTDSLRVIAEAYQEGGSTVSASAAQVASLTILNESANVTVSAVGPSGQPVIAQIRLFRMVGDKGYEVAYSSTGSLQARVVPGAFTAEAYSLSTGYELCEPEEFNVAANEDKTVTLTVRTVYFEDDFVVSPIRDEKSKKLLSARTMATLTNVYETLPGAQVKLLVTLNGESREEPLTVLGPLPLPLGQTGVPWNYIPEAGWRDGLYGFKYQLVVGEQVVAETREATLKVGGGGVSSWLWIIFVILGILGTGGLGFLIFFLLKRRKKEEEKPAKVEKKRKKEEKPVPTAAQPVRKLEPYQPPGPLRPAEPVRPVEPVEYEEPTVEPTVEPAPLSSVSTLQARMASLGRGQGMGKPAEEEPVADEEDKPYETGPLASQPVPVPPPPKIEPERPAVKKVEDKVQKPPASVKPPAQKPGIFSKVTATGKKEPPKAPGVQGSAPVKLGDEIQINWPPKTVEPPKPPSDVQINWPPKAVEPPKPPGGLGQVAPPKVEAAPPVPAPEEVVPAEEVATEEPVEPESPPSRSSFAEAARLRMEARQRASETGKPGGAPGKSQPEGDDAGESGEGGERSP